MEKTHYSPPLIILEKIKFISIFRKPIIFLSLRKIFFELRITSSFMYKITYNPPTNHPFKKSFYLRAVKLNNMNLFDFPQIIIILVAVTIIGIIYLVARAEKKRTENLKNQAHMMGLSFSDKTPDDFISNLSEFKLFTKGHSKKAYNIIEGNAQGIQYSIFDYKYTVGAGKSSQTPTQTVFSAKKENLKLPKFSMTPEYFYHKIGDLLGSKDIDFADKPIFSKKYILKGDDETTIRNTFKEEILSFFERKKEKIAIEANNSKMIIYTPSKNIKPKELTKFKDESLKIVELFTY